MVGKFGIVDFSNNKDLFTITVLNNCEDSRYIAQIKLTLTNRQPLDYFFSILNGTPYSNEETLINLLPNEDIYFIQPNIFIEPKKAETLNFRLHRPDSYPGYEIMETKFHITLDNHDTYETIKLLDCIGHFQMPLLLAKEYQDSKKTEIIGIIRQNQDIIQNAINSRIPKSGRLKTFLRNYEMEILKVKKNFSN